MSPDCRCGHLASQHAGGTYGCRNCDVGCSRYEPDIAAVAMARALPPATSIHLYDGPLTNQTESTPAQLARVTEERDRFAAAADKLHGEWLDLKAELAAAHKQIEQLDVLLAADVIGTEDGWVCLTSPYCYAANGVVFTPGHAPATEHPCGPLTPVRITVVRRLAD